MKEEKLFLTGIERRFNDNDVIVSKTDPKGRITYVNDVFINISGYSEEEIIGQPHSLIRNPDMPRCIFRLLWEYIESNKEIFAYVNNRSKNGDHYWVFAHVTPTADANNSVIGYHSNRRIARAAALDIIKPLYKKLLDIESQSADRKIGMNNSYQALLEIVASKGVAYDELMFSI